MDIFTALVHHPVLNRTGGTMTSAVTNLDVHDFARISRTYDCAGTFIVTPVTEQLRLVDHLELDPVGGTSAVELLERRPFAVALRHDNFAGLTHRHPTLSAKSPQSLIPLPGQLRLE